MQRCRRDVVGDRYVEAVQHFAVDVGERPANLGDAVRNHGDAVSGSGPAGHPDVSDLIGIADVDRWDELALARTAGGVGDYGDLIAEGRTPQGWVADDRSADDEK